MTAALYKTSGFNHIGFAREVSHTNIAIDAEDDGIAFAFQADSADPITHLGFRYGARTGTPPTYEIFLGGLDASGLPNGTDVGGGSPTLVTFTPPADTSINGLWQWKALTNAYTPSVGQFLCATILVNTGTVNGSNNSSFTRSTDWGRARVGFPYPIVMSALTWTISASIPVFGYRTANGRYGRIEQADYQTATANTAGHKSGMFFTEPSGIGSTYTVAGLEICGKFGASGGSYKVCIWNTSGTELASATFDADASAVVAGAGSLSSNRVFFTTPVQLSFGTKYYAGIEVVSGTVGVRGITLAEAEDRSSYPNGTNRGLMTYNGSFTETSTVMPYVDLILSDITAPSGGGGLMVHGGMVGGVRG